MERERKRRQLKTASGSDKTSFFQVKKIANKNVLENLFSYFVSNFFLWATSKFSINSFISTKFTSGNLSNIHNCMNMYYIFSLCVCVCVCLSVCEWAGGYGYLCVFVSVQLMRIPLKFAYSNVFVRQGLLKYFKILIQVSYPTTPPLSFFKIIGHIH